MVGDNANNKIEGADGNDQLKGLGGNDILIGGAGDDTLSGGAGKDTFDGGDGFDQLTYTSSDKGTISSLVTEESLVGANREDFTGIEGLTGSSHTDILTGDSSANLLIGGQGNDRLNGGKGSDTYRYSFGDGNDVINDYDSTNGVIDKLVFTDVTSNDVIFTSFGNNLRIILSNGEVVSIVKQLGSNDDYYIESFEFSDGVILSATDVVGLLVAPELVAGDHVGTELAEAYVHTLGDGSYSITDYGTNRYIDDQ